MHKMMPPLSALRAFEAAARHLSFTRAAEELNVTPGALSHQIRGLEEFLGIQLFERKTRAVALTPQGKSLYPGLQAGFGLIRDAVTSLRTSADNNVLVISTPPGITAKWLVPRLYRFTDQHTELDVRVSSSPAVVNLATGGTDAAIRSLPLPVEEDPTLIYDMLFKANVTPVCSPKLIDKFGPLGGNGALARVPLIHDDSLAGRPGVPTWADWITAAGLDGGDIRRGLRFTSADHALDAAMEGTGLLLTHTILAHDDLRTGRLVAPFHLTLPSSRAYHFVTPKAKLQHPAVAAFRAWLCSEAEKMELRAEDGSMIG